MRLGSHLLSLKRVHHQFLQIYPRHPAVVMETPRVHRDQHTQPDCCQRTHRDRPVRNNRTGELERPLNSNSLYRNIVRKYGQATGLNIEVNGLCVHSMRATAATNALSHEADIAKVQEWLGHANVSTTRLYDRRKTKPEDSPTFRVRY